MDVFIDLLLAGGLRNVSGENVTGNWGIRPATTGESVTENGPTASGKPAPGFLSATFAVIVKVAGLPAAARVADSRRYRASLRIADWQKYPGGSCHTSASCFHPLRTSASSTRVVAIGYESSQPSQAAHIPPLTNCHVFDRSPCEQSNGAEIDRVPTLPNVSTCRCVICRATRLPCVIHYRWR